MHNLSPQFLQELSIGTMLRISIPEIATSDLGESHIYTFKKINQRNTLTHLRVDIAADSVGVYILSETTHRSLSQCGEVLLIRFESLSASCPQ